MWLEYISNVLNILRTTFIQLSGIFCTVLFYTYIVEIRNMIPWQYNFSGIIIIREAQSLLLRVYQSCKLYFTVFESNSRTAAFFKKKSRNMKEKKKKKIF